MNNISETIITREELEYRIRTANEEGYEFAERRFEDWRENYTLYRDKVIVNRLTQRQSVNLPIMKGTMKTLLSRIDDFVELEFTNLDNNKQKELFYNQYWSDVVVKDNHLELKDKADKKQVLLFGRTFQKWNVKKGKVKLELVHPQDMRVDRLVDPTDIDSARYLIQGNIFSTLADLKLNDMYDQDVVNEIEKFFQSDEGMQLGSENEEKLREKNNAMRDLGVDDVDLPMVGQTLVEMQEGFIKVYNKDIEDEEIIFTVSAAFNGLNKILYAEFLETVIGITSDHFWRNHFPFGSWAEDLEASDFWTDAPADSVRVPNKIANSWFSQMVENRTLAYMGMNFYDATAAMSEDGSVGFVPETFEPEPFGWYAIPGDPKTIIQHVEIPQLANEIENLNFVTTIAEKASSATAIVQGVTQPKQITLGEVTLLDANATKVIQSMALFYRQNWLDLGTKYIKLLEAMGDEIEAVRLYKAGYRGNVFTREIGPADWRSKAGWSCEVISKKDKAEQNLDQIQNLEGVKSQFPGNNTFDEIYKKKLLDIVNLTPDEKKQVMDEEKKNMEMEAKLATQQSMLNINPNGGTNPPATTPTATPPMATA